MQIDASTRRNLEITQALSAGARDRCWPPSTAPVTAAPARACWSAASPRPARDLTTIRSRHDALRALLDKSRLREDLRDDLRRVPDMDRALSRLALDRGGPRDLTAIRAGLTQP